MVDGILIGKFLAAIHLYNSGTGFESQKRGFRRDPPGKAGKRSVRADDPMTGHDDRQRILAVGGANGASGLGGADRLCQIEIAPGLTERYLSQGAPDLLLKLAAAGLKRKIEAGSCAGEIFHKLALGLEQDRLLRRQRCSIKLYSVWAVAFPEHRDQRVGVCHQFELADGGFELFVK